MAALPRFQGAPPNTPTSQLFGRSLKTFGRLLHFPKISLETLEHAFDSQSRTNGKRSTSFIVLSAVCVADGLPPFSYVHVVNSKSSEAVGVSVSQRFDLRVSFRFLVPFVLYLTKQRNFVTTAARCLIGYTKELASPAFILGLFCSFFLSVAPCFLAKASNKNALACRDVQIVSLFIATLVG